MLRSWRKAQMSKPTPSRKRGARAFPSSGRTPKAVASPSVPALISPRWLVTNIGLMILGAVICAWLTLCLLFWQGSWQLLYRPTSAVTRTPATAGLPFDVIQFADTPAGVPQLQGWWIPSGVPSRFTALYFHGERGNLGDAVGDLAQFQAAGLDVFAFDYRGYGQSVFKHPSESRMHEDAEAAIIYLTDTRHIAASSIVLVGRGLGANLALEMAAAHPQFAGVVLESPLENPLGAIFNDPRALIVPASALVRDRWDTSASASNLLIPSLWFYWPPAGANAAQEHQPLAYQTTKSRKSLVWLTGSPGADRDFQAALSRWLDDLTRPSR